MNNVNPFPVSVLQRIQTPVRRVAASVLGGQPVRPQPAGRRT